MDSRRPTSGEITLKIKLIANEEVITAGYAVAVKEPPQRNKASSFWVTKGGNLTVENPRQTKLPLKEVPRAQEDVREAETPAGIKE
jgi:hypothetical protein